MRTQHAKQVDILNRVATISDAADLWNRDRGTLIQTVTNSNNFKENLDWKKSGKIILINLDAMQRVYGDPEDRKELHVGLSKKHFEDKLGASRVGHRRIKLGGKFHSKRNVSRVVYNHPEYGEIAQMHSVWFKLENDNSISDYIEFDKKLYSENKGYPKREDILTLKIRHKMI